MPLHSCWLRLDPRCLCQVSFASLAPPQFSGVGFSALTQKMIVWNWWLTTCMHRAFRRRTQTLAELHFFHYGSDTSDPIPLKGNFFFLRKNPLANHPCRNVCGCQRAHGVVPVLPSLWNEEHQFFFVRQMWPLSWLAASLIGVRGSRFFSAMQQGIPRSTASQRLRASVHSLRHCPRRHSTSQRCSHMVASDACSRRRRLLESHSLRECDSRSERCSLS